MQDFGSVSFCPGLILMSRHFRPRPPRLDPITTEIDWNRRLHRRCDLVAKVSNQAPFRYLRSLYICPMPPHCGIRTGCRIWHTAFTAWRAEGLAMAAILGRELHQLPEHRLRVGGRIEGASQGEGVEAHGLTFLVDERDQLVDSRLAHRHSWLWACTCASRPDSKQVHSVAGHLF